MLIIGELLNIQDFLFDIPFALRGQLAALRARRFSLQLILECVARRFLWACGLGEDKLLVVSAGKFAIDASGVPGAGEAIAPVRADCERWVDLSSQQRLRLEVAVAAPSPAPMDRYSIAMAQLRRIRLVQRCPDVNRIFDGEAIDREADRAWRLTRPGAILLFPAPDGAADDDAGNNIAGVTVCWSKDATVPPGGVALNAGRLSSHVPIDAQGAPIDFKTLARRSRGFHRLGVLKVNVDSLQPAIRGLLAGAIDLAPLKSLSGRLEAFFGTELHAMLSASGSPWGDLFTIWPGGDDLLLAGPWNVVLDFAIHFRDAFTRAFAAEGLTISAGVALVKTKVGLPTAVRMAEQRLSTAKTTPAPGSAAAKDQCASLKGCWKWADHRVIIDAGKQLADWVDSGAINRRWITMLLDLTQGRAAPGMTGDRVRPVNPSYFARRLWRPREEQSAAIKPDWRRVLADMALAQAAPVPAAAAVSPAAPNYFARRRPPLAAAAPPQRESQLASQIANNWPVKGPAWNWFDSLFRQFDHPHRADPLASQLPTVLRYVRTACSEVDTKVSDEEAVGDE